MRRTTLLSIGFLVLLLAAGCRSGPPPTDKNANLGLASRRQGVTGQYKGIIILDPKCSNFSNQNNQVLCIVNKGGSPVAVGGWLIRNLIGRTYYFPKGTVIKPGGTIKVNTGAGQNSATELYWNYQFKPVFSHQDQIQLVDDSDVVVSQLNTP